MQIVIDIDENVFTRLFDNGTEDYAIVNDDLFAIAKSIRKGIPLPKGHGVLKDVTNLMRGLYTDMQTEEMIFTSSEVYKLVDEECPTIIEAEIESEE